MQGGERGGFCVLEEETHNEVAVYLHFELFALIFNLLHRLADVNHNILDGENGHILRQLFIVLSLPTGDRCLCRLQKPRHVCPSLNLQSRGKTN